jgi:acetolactate synthase-1/2/3 large subunit
VVGGGIHTGAAWSPLRRVIDGFGVPVATSIHGKGAYPETGPWALGVAGANGARDYANEYLATADVVLLVGTRANSTDTNGYLSPPREAEVYQIDIDAARAGRNYPGATPLVGDASVLLTALADLAPAELPARCAESLDGIQTERSSWNAQMEARIGTFGTGVLSSYAVFRAVRQQYRDADVRIVSDCGTPTPYLGAVWETEIAERNVILARGHGPMGFAIPGAVGAAIANPDREIVCFTTDGSFAMSCGELETAARLSLPIRFIHLSNQSLGWIKMLQHLYFGQRYHGVEGSAADPVPVAMGFGVPAIRAHTLLDLQDALDRDRSSQGPTFIDVHVPDQTVEVPPVAPWHAALLGDSQRPVY